MYPYWQYKEDIDNPFGCCGFQYLDYLQLLEKEYWQAANECIDKLLVSVYAKEVYGKDVECAYNKINNFVYFLSLMKKIYYENINYYAISGEYHTAKYYNEIYDFECMRKLFWCDGCDILPLLSIFNMNYTTEDEDAKDGIGYMAITPNTTSYPHFRIF